MEDTNHLPRPVRILGMGNVLMGDDALGPYVARLLEARFELPANVEVLDVGTPGLDLTPYLSDAEAVIVVDTVRSAGPPGTLRTYRQHELLAAPAPSRMSPHEPGLREALMATELTDTTPAEVTLVGVVPGSTTAGTALSPAVEAVVDDVIATVIQELDRLGVPARRRATPLDPDIWWESG